MTRPGGLGRQRAGFLSNARRLAWGTGRAGLTVISHHPLSFGSSGRKGGALAPPKSGAFLLFLSRLPRSLRPQVAREAREGDSRRAL